MSFQSLNRVIFGTSLAFHHISLSKRLYSRWMHRRPSKVLLPFESTPTDLKKEKVINLDPETLFKRPEEKINKVEKQNVIPKEKVVTPEQCEEIKEKRKNKINKIKTCSQIHNVFNENNEIIYEKCKDNDGRVSSLLVNVKSKKHRANSKMILVEGWRLIVDGLEAKCPLRYVLFSRTEDLNNIRSFLPKTGVKIYKVPYKELQLWSTVETSPGILGIFDTPQPENLKTMARPFPVQIICDNIRIPGNLGAILRVSAGMGCERVLLTKGCVDCWDPKVIRSAAGAHFKIPIHYSIEWEDIEKIVLPESTVFIADSNANINDETLLEETSLDRMANLSSVPVLPYYSVDYGSLKTITLVVGGETEGISEESYGFAASRNGMRLNIPLQRGVDSLNTGMATAVIAFEIKKQLLLAYQKIKQGRMKFEETSI